MSEEPKKPRKKRTSMTALTRKYLIAKGWRVESVEHVIPYKFIKQDTFAADIIGLNLSVGIALFQVTGGEGGNFANRRTKCLEHADVPLWLRCGGKFYLHGWNKTKSKLTGRPIWRLRCEQIVLEQDHLAVREIVA